MSLCPMISCLGLAALVAAAPACADRDDGVRRPAAVATAVSAGDAHAAADAGPDGAVASIPEVGPATAVVPPLPRVTTWALDPENSSVTFMCKHSDVTKVRGMFQRPTGSVVLDAASPAGSSVRASIDVATITTGVEERDSHLKSPEFFDSARFPAITFESSAVAASHDGGYVVTGNLTMHGVTRPVTLAVTASAPFQHFGTIRRGIEATTAISRQEFGVGVAAWNVAAESGGLLIGDRVTITIDAELVLQPAARKGA